MEEIVPASFLLAGIKLLAGSKLNSKKADRWTGTQRTRVTRPSIFHLNCLHQYLSIYEGAQEVPNMVDPLFQILISRAPG